MREDLTGDYPFPPSREQLEQHERDMDRIRAEVASEKTPPPANGGGGKGTK